MTKRRPMTIDDLWALDRVGAPSLAPDGKHAALAVTTPSMKDNKATSAIWLLSMDGAAPRRLTQAGDKDSQPQFSPRGDALAFLARREQAGKKDADAQLYVIATDGGEARRVGDVATGIDAFRWLPDGKRVAFISWVWPDAKGAKAQAKRHKAFSERKETGYATRELWYRFWDRPLPMGRVPHLHVMDVDRGKTRDLFEGTAYELPRGDPDTNTFAISPDGRRIAFGHDPHPEKRLDHWHALAEVDVKSGKVRELLRDPAWDFGCPAYSPDGQQLAFIAAHRGHKATMPQQLALLDLARGTWRVVSSEWDHEVEAPLHWSEDGASVIFAAEQQGRRHVWRFDLAARRAEPVVQGGWVHAFDHAAGTLVSVASSALHPERVHAHVPGHAPLRIETFNDDRLRKLDLGRVEERWVKGARGDKVQLWLTYPAAFDAALRKRAADKARKRWPLQHVIHGGPHAAAGDTWSMRWNDQLHAAQGRVVARVNYHGSSGFGYAFKDAISGRLGEFELQDIEAATDALLKEPWVDRARVHASGGSYGGFMVAWMNGHVKPGRYASYVCHAGCFDWQAMFADDCFTWQQHELSAWYWVDPKKVASQSPSAFAQHMRTPTLVTHGALDYRVPDQQGLAYYNTLKARGVDAQLLWFPDENHWVLKPRNSKQWHEAFFAWLDRHERGDAKGKRKPSPAGARADASTAGRGARRPRANAAAPGAPD